MRKISKVRFEALSYARMPLVKIMSDEIEWYANENNAILGTILHDYTDDDYVAVVLGRDEAGVFRWIDGLAGIESIDEARATLSEKIIEQSREGAEEFPQGVITRDKNLIFNPLVREARMPEDYKTLVNSEFFSPAKELIQEIAYSFEDPDGNYIEQFQSTGFNARLWELYLYALFHEMDFMINREFNAPDYVVDKAGLRVCIEAVTVNPSQHLVDEPEPTTTEEMDRLLPDYMPIKYGSPLYSKLQKKYWEKAHVAEHPLVIAIHDFHQKDSMMWSRKALEVYLFGAKRTYSYSPESGLVENVDLITEHRWNDKVIPSNFFSQPDAENISAIIHSNQATIGKFLRMGYLAEFGRQDLDIKFVGQAMYDNNQAYIDFDMDVIPEEYEEYWKDSVTIYHNPNALRPLDHRLFPNVAHVFFSDGKFSSIKPQYYPVYGRTLYRAKEI
ncbi:hypothetical protein AAFX30_10870 [Vibrio chagasii]|uniref:hypothetical protein n=1 Tax=Vibrio chagasii TaxID=170679 RepID=UPI0038CD61E0